jgi:hypothetical protein
MAYRGFSGAGFVGNHLSTALLEQLRPAADSAGRVATVGSPATRAAWYFSDGEAWRAVSLVAEAPGPSGGDDTAALQTAINAASAAYSASAGRTRLVFRPGLYLITGLAIKPNVWYDFGDAVFKKTNEGSGAIFGTTCSLSQSMLRTQESLVGGTTYYGNYDNIRVTGGIFDTNGFGIYAGAFTLVNCRDLVVEGTKIVRTGAQAFYSTIFGGQNITIRDFKVTGGTIQGQDGIHIVHGQDIKIIGGDIYSGDDAIAIGNEDNLDIRYDDEGIARVSVTNVSVRSQAAYALKCYYKANMNGGTYRNKIDGVTVRNLHGVSGITSGGGVSIRDYTVAASRVCTNIQNVDAEVDLQCGSTAHDGTGVEGINIDGGTNIRIGGTIRITDTIGGALRWYLGVIRLSVQGRFEVNCPSLPELGGYYVYNATTATQNRDNFFGGTMVAGSTTTGAHIALIDAPRTTITAAMLGIRTSTAAVRCNVSTGTLPSITVIGAVFAEASGATSTIGINSAGAGRLSHASIVGCDFSAVDAALDASFTANVPTYCFSGNRGLANAEDVTP